MLDPIQPAQRAARWPPPTIRSIGPRTRQAGVIAYTHEEQRGLVVCLVSAKSGGWTLPKGHVDRGYKPHEAAAIEAYEEAGLLGEVTTDAVGHYDYEKNSGKRCRVRLFPMRVSTILTRWDEQYARERIWIEPTEAEHWLEMPDPIRLIEAFSALRVAPRDR